MTNFEKIEVTFLVLPLCGYFLFFLLVNTQLLTCLQVVNRLHKDYVYDTLLNYGVHYDNTWIYDKIHHEINQFCSAHSLQQVYIDMFDQVMAECQCLN